VLTDRRHVQLPRIGVLKTHESTRKLARRLEQGSARILAATISRTADRWFVSFTVEVQRAIPQGNGHDTVRRIARVHARVANVRRDALHKLTTTLATQHGTIVIEDLNLGGLVRNRHLARALADTGLGELRRQLAYKTGWYGSRLVAADRFYPSSKTCSACGWVKAKLTLVERTFHCEACGLRLDRDLNAARNLAKLAQHVAQSGWETQNARGADRKTQPAGQVATKREPSSPLLQRA
jgi:IS605 OrfB family transposase